MNIHKEPNMTTDPRESAIIALTDAWNLFMQIDPIHVHKDDLTDFRKCIHDAQRILYTQKYFMRLTEEDKVKGIDLVDVELFYFGTNFIDAGHYDFKVTHNELIKIREPYQNVDAPFDRDGSISSQAPFGTYIFKSNSDIPYTAISISGSPRDNRYGSKMVFWIRADINFIQFKDFLLTHPVTSGILRTFENKHKIQW